MHPVASSIFRRDFPQDEGIIHFNHAGVAPISARGAARLAQVAGWMVGSVGRRYAAMEALFEESRQRCARLLGVTPEEVALVGNTSEGLSMIAIGLAWRPGDEVVIPASEFPSNAVIWLREAERHGGVVHRVSPAADGYLSVASLLERVTPRTRVVATSSVQYASGTAVDLAALGAALKGTETLLVVDAIQSLGALPMNAPALGVDAVAADGHKWLLAAEGCGPLYLSPKARAQVTPRIVGWHSVVNAGRYDQITTELRPDMKCFEAGSFNLLGAAVLGESVGLLLEAGLENVAQRVRQLTGALAAGIREQGGIIHTPTTADGLPAAGIVVFSHPALDTPTLHRRLLAAGVIQVQRGSGVRLSPHFYQDHTEVERFLEILTRCL